MTTLEDIVEFKGSPQLVEQLYALSQVKLLNKGDHLLRENAYIKSIPIVMSGSLRIMRVEEDGKEIMLYYIQAGESCIMSFFSGLQEEKSILKAVADEEAEILFLPVEKLKHLMREFPQWTEYMFRLYHKRFQELIEVIDAVAFKKVDERLLSLLQKKASYLQTNKITVTHEQLANELGTARVVVSRLLKQLEDSGVVELGRNSIIMLS